MESKILVSGNRNYGLAQEIAATWPQCEFWSRTNNSKDFTLPNVRQEFAQHSLDFDLYISCSALQDFAQVTLLREVVELWIQNKKAGTILVLGSGADITTKGITKTYALEKKSLRTYCQQISLMAQSPEHGLRFKICYLSVGHLNTPGKSRRHPDAPHIELATVVKTMDWILSQPSHLLVSELTIAPLKV